MRFLYRIIIMVAVLFLSDRCGLTEVEYSYFENGKISSKSEIYKGVKNGLSIEYYPNGVIKNKLYFKNGQIHGVKKSYSAEGLLLEELCFENGKKSGVYKAYYINGALKREGVYKNDSRHGFFNIYSENGLLVSKIKFSKIDGKEVAILQWIYNKKGEIVNEKSGIKLLRVSEYKYKIGLDGLDTYDSAILIYGFYDEEISTNPNGYLDTVNIKLSKVISIKSKLLIGDSSLLRGKVIMRNEKLGRGDTVFTSTSSFFFEKYYIN